MFHPLPSQTLCRRSRYKKTAASWWGRAKSKKHFALQESMCANGTAGRRETRCAENPRDMVIDVSDAIVAWTVAGVGMRNRSKITSSSQSFGSSAHDQSDRSARGCKPSWPDSNAPPLAACFPPATCPSLPACDGVVRPGHRPAL